MANIKRKSTSHIIGEQALDALKSRLPTYWTIREYRPDYGIDLAIELFEANGDSFDTLGEHLFVQLKGSTNLKTKSLTLLQRTNVEKAPFKLQQSLSKSSNMDVVKFSIDTSELVTIQRMSAAAPVLLVVVDTVSRRIFFVCLNDYIDKILLPEDSAYATPETKTVYIPIKNEITGSEESLIPLRFYAKRAKLYAAFQKISYQTQELNYTSNSELINRANHFAEVLLRYDFWQSCDWWKPIGEAYIQLCNLLQDGKPHLWDYQAKHKDELLTSEGWQDNFCHSDETYSYKEIEQFRDIRLLWQQLANLGAIYEEICREWFLPTDLGNLTSLFVDDPA